MCYFVERTQKCTKLFFNHYKAKIISDKLRSQLNVSAVDVRLEMRGHDFISVLYHALYKHKRISMSEEDFANSTWLCLDSKLLEVEPLFQRVLAL